MSFVTLYSKYLLVPILTEWLTLPELVYFDTSLCNARARQIMLAATSTCEGIFERAFFESSEFPLSIVMIDWMLRRGIRIESVSRYTLNNLAVAEWLQCDESKFSALMDSLSTSVLAVKIEITSENVVADYCKVLCGFHALTHFSVSDCDDLPFLLASLVSSQFVSLTLHNCYGSATQALQELLSRQTALRVLSVQGCPGVTTAALQGLRCSLRTLEWVDRSASFDSMDLGPYCQYDLESFSAYGVSPFLKLGTNCFLTSVNLSHSPEFRDDHFEALVLSCRELTDVDISYCPSLTDKVLITINTYMPQLRRLVLAEIYLTSDLFSAFCKKSLQLSDLELTGCQGLSYGALYDLGNCTALTRLELSGTAITSVGINHIIECCPGLADVSLTCSTYDESRLSAGLHSRGCQLTALDLSWTTFREGDGLEALFKHTPGLTSLCLSGCSGLTELAVLSAVSHCQLRSLDVSHNATLPLSGSLANCMVDTQHRTLRRLLINGLVITNSVLRMLLLGLRKLRALGVARNLFDELVSSGIVHANLLVVHR